MIHQKCSALLRNKEVKFDVSETLVVDDADEQTRLASVADSFKDGLSSRIFGGRTSFFQCEVEAAAESLAYLVRRLPFRINVAWMVRVVVAVIVPVFLTACSSFPSAGPTREETQVTVGSDTLPIKLMDMDEAVVKRTLGAERRVSFADAFGGSPALRYTLGPGDVLEISIWEAPPAILFGSSGADPRTMASATRVTTFPEQMVSHDGVIRIPFAGLVAVAGQSPQDAELEIARRLQGKANQPQVVVRVTRNATSNVTIVGEVGQSVRMPLTAKGERLLDAIAAAGGVRQPVGKVTIQLTRGELVQGMPLENVIRDPKQNIFLKAGDVITALFQPLSFTALGATGKNEEIFFEAQGITLAQALARSGGLQDQRADAKGVFIFRYEEPLVLGIAGENPPLTPDGKVPVIYRVDLKDPRNFFIAQGFPIRNKDVLYVSNAPAAELQKFLNILTSVVFSAQGLGAIGK